MLAMTLLLLDFVLIPVSLVVLIVLLAMYYRSWTAWRRSMAPSGEQEGCGNDAQ